MLPQQNWTHEQKTHVVQICTLKKIREMQRQMSNASLVDALDDHKTSTREANKQDT